MKALRIPAPPPEVNPALLCGNIVTRYRKILTTESAPNRLLRIRGEKGISQEVIENKGST
jgi:hypothetical protein